MTDKIERVTGPNAAASFVVCDRQIGKIVLTHHASAAPGAVLPPDKEMAHSSSITQSSRWDATQTGWNA